MRWTVEDSSPSNRIRPGEKHRATGFAALDKQIECHSFRAETREETENKANSGVRLRAVGDASTTSEAQMTADELSLRRLSALTDGQRRASSIEVSIAVHLHNLIAVVAGRHGRAPDRLVAFLADPDKVVPAQYKPDMRYAPSLSVVVCWMMFTWHSGLAASQVISSMTTPGTGARPVAVTS
jgi:hypothetical protein